MCLLEEKIFFVGVGKLLRKPLLTWLKPQGCWPQQAPGVASSSQDCTFLRTDPAAAMFRSGLLLPSTHIPVPAYVTAAVSWYDEFQRLYDTIPCVEVQALKEHSDQVLHLSFSHSGYLFASCSKDCTVKVKWQPPLHNPPSFDLVGLSHESSL